MKCDGCGLEYDRFRTGLTFHEVYHAIYDRKWKRRHGVLGAWRQFKLEMWEQHTQQCEADPVPF